MSRQTARSRLQMKIIFYSQHFGTGVLIATAFVHLLPMAFTSLTDPCLPDAFSKKYRPMAGLVAMVAALAVVAVESYLTTRGASHSHSHHLHGFWDNDDEAESSALDTGITAPRTSLAARRLGSHRPADIALDGFDVTDGLVAGVSPLPESTPTIITNQRRSFENRVSTESDRESDLDLDIDELDPTSPSGPQSRPLARPHGHSDVNRVKIIGAAASASTAPTPEEQKRLILQCLLLEAGILFHSIFIGMALSVATGPTFVVFLIAISFHQTFEGLALGGRIAAIQFPKASIRPWLMVLAYGITTPLGQAIGLIIHEMYDPKSQTGLLLVGFMNAISSGLLLFAGLVQLLAEDFLTPESYKNLRGQRRVNAFLAVVGGAGLMAAVRAIS
jgi:solute carrier family 39 (zinc transporter), member 1/2/3